MATAPLTADTLATSLPATRERGLRIAFGVFGITAAAALTGHLAVLLWARHAFTGVEAMVALHSNMLAHGEGLYRDLNRYPFTVSAYGPVFYTLTALLEHLGVPLYQGARTISFLSLLGALWCAWRVLGVLVVDLYARIAGVLLAAATANFVFWGTTGQVDMLAIFWSLAAFWQFLRWREERAEARLVTCGVLVVLAVFTKQTAVAAAATVACCLLWEDRKRGAIWVSGVAGVALSAALGVNALNHGHFFENAIFANMNPLRWGKLAQQAQYLTLTAGGLIAVAVVGARYTARLAPLYLYTGVASAVWLATSPKVGSDLNYQIEMTLLWCLSAAVALDRLELFPKIIAGGRSWVTLLQVPLALHLVLNLAVAAKTLAERAVLEPVKRADIAALRPYLSPERGRVLAAPYDAMLKTRGRIEVETLIYSLLVDAGRIDPRPVLRDIEARTFQTIVLYHNVFSGPPGWDSPELTALPKAHLDAVRANYRLVKHVDGPFLEGEYIYEPLRD